MRAQVLPNRKLNRENRAETFERDAIDEYHGGWDEAGRGLFTHNGAGFDVLHR